MVRQENTHHTEYKENTQGYLTVQQESNAIGRNTQLHWKHKGRTHETMKVVHMKHYEEY